MVAPQHHCWTPWQASPTLHCTTGLQHRRRCQLDRSQLRRGTSLVETPIHGPATRARARARARPWAGPHRSAAAAAVAAAGSNVAHAFPAAAVESALSAGAHAVETHQLANDGDTAAEHPQPVAAAAVAVGYEALSGTSIRSMNTHTAALEGGLHLRPAAAWPLHDAVAGAWAQLRLVRHSDAAVAA